MTSQSQNVPDLLKTAQDQGNINPTSLAMLNIPNLTRDMNRALGTPAININAAEVTLFNMVIDDSYSIKYRNNTQHMRDGYNLCLKALNKSKTRDGILVQTRYINGTLLHPYLPLSEAIPLDKDNYDPNGITPMYDQLLVSFATLLAKVQEFANNGVPARTVSLFAGDGKDEGSTKTAAHVRPVVEDMLSHELVHIISAMGIDDGETDFIKVFTDMGIQTEWILTPKSDPKSIRLAWNQASDSALSASQAASFSDLGGFGV